MCVQTVGLVQAEIEMRGIPTVSISLLKEVTSILRPPRALFVPFPMGYPLGAPNDPEIQLSVIRQALASLAKEETPLLAEFEPESHH